MPHFLPNPLTKDKKDLELEFLFSQLLCNSQSQVFEDFEDHNTKFLETTAIFHNKFLKKRTTSGEKIDYFLIYRNVIKVQQLQ